MKVALLGLIQSGKSTFFASLSGREITPVGSTNIEESIIKVPDERIETLAEHYKPKKTTHATINCLDVPGFNFADEHGRSAARRLIDKIRTVDMLALIIRAFDNSAANNPVQDIQQLKTELLLADLELVTTRVEKLEVQIKKPTKTQAKDKEELALQKKLQQTLESEKPISRAIENDTERQIIKSLGFLTLKPMIIVLNAGEDQLQQKLDLTGIDTGDMEIVQICAKLEYELSQLDADSREAFMKDLGIIESAAGKFVKSCYSALGLISFLTVGSDDVRAWPIKQGTAALDAAGKIHSDIKRGFIRAETFSFEEFKEYGDEKSLKAAGKTRLEGKDYVVQDGDIINFRFNV